MEVWEYGSMGLGVMGHASVSSSLSSTKKENIRELPPARVRVRTRVRVRARVRVSLWIYYSFDSRGYPCLYERPIMVGLGLGLRLGLRLGLGYFVVSDIGLVTYDRYPWP